MKKIVLCLMAVIVGLHFAVHRHASETIVIYSSLEQYRNDALQDKLAVKFPDIPIQIMYLPTAKVAAKVRAEGKATDADILLGVETGYLELITNRLEQVSGYSRLDYLDGLNPRHGKYLIWESYGGGFAVNTNILKKLGLPEPRTYEDLLNPKYRNLIALQDPKSSSTGYNFYLNLRNTRGIEETLLYYDRLNRNVKLYSESSSGPVKLLIQGECAIGTALTYQVVMEMNRGNPLKMIYPPEGSPYSVDGLAMIEGRSSDSRIEAIFTFLANDCLVYDKAHYNPGKVLCGQKGGMANYPSDIPYADMKDLWNPAVKKELLARWKY